MIGIYANSASERAVNIADEICNRLSRQGVEYIKLNKKFSQSVNLILVIGGDGTILDIVVSAAERGIPVLALNAGGTGFLARYEDDEIDECVEFIAKGNFETDERPLICCSLGNKIFYALNDFSVQRASGLSESSCTLSLALVIGGEFVDRFRADGMIVATPTGSTAYSLSAGGAILTPSLGAMIATPLCAHTLRSKPIVFSDSDSAEIIVEGRSAGAVYADGRFASDIQVGQKIVVKKSEYSVKFIKNKENFYKTLLKKLTSWSDK